MNEFKAYKTGDVLSFSEIQGMIVSDSNHRFLEEYGVMVPGRKFLVSIQSDEKVVSFVFTHMAEGQPYFKVVHSD